MSSLKLPAVSRPLYGWLAFATALVVCDQATKAGATAWLMYGVPHPMLPGFNLTLLHNTGAAFSFLHDGAGWQRWLFTAIAVIVAGVVVLWLARIGGGQRWASCSLALILGGALGNLIDRVRLGYVVDFIQIYYGAWSFPAFNLADSAITVGACMLILRGPQPAASRSVA